MPPVAAWKSRTIAHDRLGIFVTRIPDFNSHTDAAEHISFHVLYLLLFQQAAFFKEVMKRADKDHTIMLGRKALIEKRKEEFEHAQSLKAQEQLEARRAREAKARATEAERARKKAERREEEKVRLAKEREQYQINMRLKEQFGLGGELTEEGAKKMTQEEVVRMAKEKSKREQNELVKRLQMAKRNLDYQMRAMREAEVRFWICICPAILVW